MPYFYSSDSAAVWYTIQEFAAKLFAAEVIEKRQPKNLAEIGDLPLEIGMVSIYKFKKLRTKYVAGQDTQILRIVALLAAVCYQDTDCIKLCESIDLETCTPDLRQVLYFINPQRTANPEKRIKMLK